jgi:hypothetical protein
LRASISAGRAIRVSDEEGLEGLKEYKVPPS